jgi:tripartite-type tricarboxylate transporter receptor subunit TctC
MTMRAALAVLAFVTACVPAATAQTFPARTVRIIVHCSARGTGRYKRSATSVP